MAGGVRGRGVHAGGGSVHGTGACMTGGCAWQERWPLQWTVHILLECILVDSKSKNQVVQKFEDPLSST